MNNIPFKVLLLLTVFIASACSPCKRFVKYQTYQIDVGGPEINIPKMIKNDSTSEEKQSMQFKLFATRIGDESIRYASQAIQILDHTQFQNCQLIQFLPTKDRKNIMDRMNEANFSISQLALIVNMPAENIKDAYIQWSEHELKRQEIYRKYQDEPHVKAQIQDVINNGLAPMRKKGEEIETTKANIAIGGFYSYLDKKLQSSLLMNVEMLYMPFKLAPTFEAGFMNWKKDETYNTFQGQQGATVAIEQNNDLKFAGFGARRYFSLTKDIDSFVGFIAGYSWERDKEYGAQDWYGNILAGVALYPKKFKVAFEVRYVNYAIAEKDVQFNPFGSATSRKKVERRDGIAIGILFSPLVW